jgi:5-methylcytosine-specific restriction protein A
MARSEFPRKVKSQAWARCGGRCEKCTAKLFPGKYAYDHDLPDQMGGEPTLANCRVLCDACHGEKTFTVDIPTIRKSDRQRDKHIGAMRPKQKIPSKPFGGFASNARDINADLIEETP